MVQTYSFSDVTAIFSHPDFGDYSITGEGCGKISIIPTNDTSSVQTSADGSAVISKITVRSANIEVSVLQTHSLNQNLQRIYNYTNSPSVPASKFLMTLVIKNASTGEQITCNGVSFRKNADTMYDKEAQEKIWALISGDTTTEIV